MCGVDSDLTHAAYLVRRRRYVRIRGVRLSKNVVSRLLLIIAYEISRLID